MKIVQLTPFFYPHIGGVSSHVFEVSKELTKRDNDVYVLTTLLGSRKREEVYENIKIYRFPIFFSISEYAKFWNFIPKLLEIKPDIIHSHVYGHPHSTLSSIIGKMMSTLSILTTHAPFLPKGYRSPFLDKMVKINDISFGKISLHLFRKIIAISKWEFKYLKEMGINESRITFIPNGINKLFTTQKNEEKNYLGSKYGIGEDWLKILFLGRVHPIKGLETLIRAAIEVSRKFKIVLFIVGPYEEKYKNYLYSIYRSKKTRNLKVIFTGPVYDIREKIKFYDSCDVFVLPSLREAFPIVLLEAMSRGCPIISSDTMGAKDIIVEGVNGLIFKKGDYLDLAKKIETIARNPDIAKRFSKNNRKKAKQFTWDKIVDKIEKVYREVLNQ